MVHLSGDAYGVGTNISYNQIVSQVSALNAAFSKSYPGYNGQTHPSYAQNTNIQFCLAKIAKPSGVTFYNGPGGIENGVMRYSDNTLTHHDITSPSATALLGLTHPIGTYFPFNDYLNIWVVASIGSGGGGTVMGYAPKPLMGVYPLDGVVMRSDIIGDNSTGSSYALGFGLEQGKVMSHEIGHYLNLYHIFEGGCAGANAAGSSADACDLNGDGICDIEPCTTQNISCGMPIPNTCSASYTTGTTTIDMINSYMSYADDDCMNTFTTNQSQRMWATLNASRFNLWQTSNLSSTGVIGAGGCIAPFLITNIKASTNSICSGTSFVLSNPTSGNSATTRNWFMPGASPSIATTPSVSVTYTAPGLYWAYLTLSDGILTAKDSFLVKVANCTLDSTKLNRSHWFFGDYAELNFSTPGGVTAGTSAFTHTTMYHGKEASVSMSDKYGNLLFYTNGADLWDNNHIKRSTDYPMFVLDTDPYGAWPSASSMLAIPFPKDTSKYIIISGPHTSGVSFPYSAYYDSLYYVVYDVNTKIVTSRRGFKHSLLPTTYAEPITVVPHCNGYDYWLICRSANKAYSVLITAAGPNNIDKITISSGISAQVAGQFKSNRKGNRLIRSDNWGSNKIGFFYDFNSTTGLMNNETSFGYTSVNNTWGAIFSPNDSLAYITEPISSSGSKIYQINVNTLAIKTMSITTDFMVTSIECGPDNNLYFRQDYLSWSHIAVDRIINSNSWVSAAFVKDAVPLPTGTYPWQGITNFMDAAKPAEIANDFIYTNVSCNTFKFTVDSCWQVYKVNWNFGDGTTGTGLLANHTYTSTGAFTVKMTLSIGTYSLNTIIKNITVLSGTTSIAGPTVICKGTTYLNNYGVSIIPGATYNWGIVNGVISGPTNLSNVNLGASSTGVATISVQIVSGGCISVGTKTIVIDTIPSVSMPSHQPICLGDIITLSGSPSGGIFGGTGVTSNLFNSTLTGVGNQTVYYTITNMNGCSNTATNSITVNACVGIDENEFSNSTIQIYPNPNSGEFNVLSSRELKNGKIEIYNYLGQLIINETLIQNLKINLSNNSNGIYLVRILENNKTIDILKVLKE